MRRLPTVLLGALMLPVGFLPSAAFADTVVSEPTATVSATADPEPSATASPTPSATVSPTPSATTVPTPTATEDPDPDPDLDYLSGDFTIKPEHGKPGTVITATSKTKCVDDAGVVSPHLEFLVFSAADLESEEPKFTVDKVVKTDSSGAWKTTAKIPTSAKTGDLYALIAACFDKDTKPSFEAEPFLVYEGLIFTVTAADKAPIATPVAGDPNYTG